MPNTFKNHHATAEGAGAAAAQPRPGLIKRFLTLVYDAHWDAARRKVETLQAIYGRHSDEQLDRAKLRM